MTRPRDEQAVRRHVWVAAVMGLAWIVAATAALAAPKRALVIGNAAYDVGRLRNPVNDATDMATTLRELGFDVELLRDVDRRTMENAVHTFSRSVQPGEIGLFYFAGHGMQVQGQNYLLPIGARIDSEADIGYQAIPAGWVLAKMEEAGRRLNVVILDACRNNPYKRRWRSATRGLARMSELEGSIVAYATAPGNVADDGPGRNGVYTKHLLQQMRRPGVSLEHLFRQVRVAVKQETSGRQVPWESSSLTQPFFFVPAAPTRPQTTACSAAETAMWEVARTSTVPGDVAEFLRVYPQGCFTSAARLRLSQLQRQQPQPVQVAVGVTEEQTWRNSIGMTFVRIPAGEFLMGSNQGDNDEKPVHRVRISRPSYLGTHEVTQRQWQAVMGNNPSQFKGDDRPVERVSWEDAQTFMRQLNAREPGETYRLPTEAEWEYAARAGSTTAYHFGDSASRLDAYAWYGKGWDEGTQPVGRLQPNRWGLYDMHGNVWEWVQDWYGQYYTTTATDPQGPSSGQFRVLRGGSFGNSPANLRSADRASDRPEDGFRNDGFRCVRVPPQP